MKKPSAPAVPPTTGGGEAPGASGEPGQPQAEGDTSVTAVQGSRTKESEGESDSPEPEEELVAMADTTRLSPVTASPASPQPEEEPTTAMAGQEMSTSSPGSVHLGLSDSDGTPLAPANLDTIFMNLIMADPDV